MILDNLNRLVAAQVWAASAVTTNSLPLKVAGRDILAGEPLAMVFTVTKAAAVAGTEAYTFRAQTATNADGSTGAVTLISTPTYTVSGGTFANREDILPIGTIIVLPLPVGTTMDNATHLAGHVTIASSGDIGCNVDVMRLCDVEQSTKKYEQAAVFG